jgi:hypothetical protein
MSETVSRVGRSERRVGGRKLSITCKSVGPSYQPRRGSKRSTRFSPWKPESGTFAATIAQHNGQHIRIAGMIPSCPRGLVFSGAVRK